jgi:hypothetical protein
MGHRERDYGQEGGGDYVYKAGPPTLLAAGFAETEITASTTGVTITMKPLTVAAQFISAAPGPTPDADTEGVTLGAADDWKLTWTLSEEGLAQLKGAQANLNKNALFRAVKGKAWETGSDTGFSDSAVFDYDTGQTGMNLGAAPKGASCAAWFNLEYAPFSLSMWDGPVWVIRNGINDLAQDANTDFDADVDNGEKVKWNATVNGNGAVVFTVPPFWVTDLDLTFKVPAPVTGGTPVYSFTDAQYAGVVEWKRVAGDGKHSGVFLDGTAYKAVVTLTAAAGRTFEGIPATPEAGCFSHQGQNVTVSHQAGTAGSTLDVTITFPVTANNVINIDTVADGDSGPGWSFAGNTLTLRASSAYIITGNTGDSTTNRIKAAPYITATVVLEDGVGIDVSGELDTLLTKVNINALLVLWKNIR